MFENSEIALDALPDLEDLDWQAMHPKFVRRQQLEHGLFALLPLTAAIIFTLNLSLFFKQSVLLWIIAIGFLVASVIWPMISVPRRGYTVRDKDIVFKSGVIWRSVTAIPFNRVQHVETSSTPLDRRFGLANLQIFTAGGSGGDLKIAGLGADTAEQLRVYILDKVGASIEIA